VVRGEELEVVRPRHQAALAPQGAGQRVAQLENDSFTSWSAALCIETKPEEDINSDDLQSAVTYQRVLHSDDTADYKSDIEITGDMVATLIAGILPSEDSNLKWLNERIAEVSEQINRALMLKQFLAEREMQRVICKSSKPLTPPAGEVWLQLMELLIRAEDRLERTRAGLESMERKANAPENYPHKHERVHSFENAKAADERLVEKLKVETLAAWAEELCEGKDAPTTWDETVRSSAYRTMRNLKKALNWLSEYYYLPRTVEEYQPGDWGLEEMKEYVKEYLEGFEDELQNAASTFEGKCQ